MIRAFGNKGRLEVTITMSASRPTERPADWIEGLALGDDVLVRLEMAGSLCGSGFPTGKVDGLALRCRETPYSATVLVPGLRPAAGMSTKAVRGETDGYDFAR
jgi:hypothetical protein